MGMQELRMYYSAACVLVGFLIGGCMPQPADVIKPNPDEIVDSGYDEAGRLYVQQYALGLSRAAAEVAANAKAKQYSSSVSLNEDWTAKTKQVRIDAQNVLIGRMNAVANEEPDSPKMIELFDGLSIGFKKGLR